MIELIGEYPKKSMFDSMVTIVFAKNYLKHSKVNGMCVKSTPVLAGEFLYFRVGDLALLRQQASDQARRPLTPWQSGPLDRYTSLYSMYIQRQALSRSQTQSP